MRRSVVFGYDFGTLSCRLLALDTQTGAVVGQAVYTYTHGIITQQIPDSEVSLASDWCLQHPDDYLDAVCSLSQTVLEQNHIRAEEVVAIGTDFTNCTMMPITHDGRVLCQFQQYREEPHAWVKLWKHHAAQSYAKEIEVYARKNAPWLYEYGNCVSSEWMFPKILQILREAPHIYEAADYFIEAADWIVLQLSGRIARNSATLGLNCFYSPSRGFPNAEFFAGIDPRMRTVVEDKMGGDIVQVGTAVGNLTSEMARRMGLTTDTIVCAGHGDSEIAACGMGSILPNQMIMVLGTSACYQIMHVEKRCFDGICAVVQDGMVPGYYSYESGQPAVGDIFGWFADHLADSKLQEEACLQSMTVLELLGEKATRIKPGESGLIGLDWFNGNRSTLMDYDLSGMLLGLTLHTKSEEIYRALIEATAFGAKMIFDQYEQNGIRIEKWIGAGGLAFKSPLLMQIYADVLGHEIHVPCVENVSASGACVCAAVAAGASRGGHDSFADAVAAMIPKESIQYKPDRKNHAVYQRLYMVYKELYELMGRSTDVMKQIKQIKNGTITTH